jgi:hypothetical protein
VYKDWFGPAAPTFLSLLTFGVVVAVAVGQMPNLEDRAPVADLLKLIFWSVPAM